MDITIKRTTFEADGIFGIMADTTGKVLAVTLEHAYDSSNGDGTFIPKLPTGTYTCQRGQHQLAGMSQPFTTFEIMNVPGHTNILIHWGNFNKDSEGCVLIGETIDIYIGGSHMITSSRITFENFMSLQSGVDSFTLVVS
jgi:hypothetical protein